MTASRIEDSANEPQQDRANCDRFSVIQDRSLDDGHWRHPDVDFGLGLVGVAYAGHGQQGFVRPQLRPSLHRQHGGCRLVAAGLAVGRIAPHHSFKAGAVWLQALGQTGGHLCTRGRGAWRAHLCGLLPIRLPLH